MGGVYVNLGHDGDLEGTVYVDAIAVTSDSVVPTADASWGRVKGHFDAN